MLWWLLFVTITTVTSLTEQYKNSPYHKVPCYSCVIVQILNAWYKYIKASYVMCHICVYYTKKNNSKRYLFLYLIIRFWTMSFFNVIKKIKKNGGTSILFHDWETVHVLHIAGVGFKLFVFQAFQAHIYCTNIVFCLRQRSQGRSICL